jgi:hypothetical protein
MKREGVVVHRPIHLPPSSFILHPSRFILQVYDATNNHHTRPFLIRHSSFSIQRSSVSPAPLLRLSSSGARPVTAVTPARSSSHNAARTSSR